MALATNVFSVQLRRGLDTKTDSKLVIAGKLLLLENGVFSRPGVITKRPGYQLLSNTLQVPLSVHQTILTSGQGLFTFNSELLEANSTTLFSYNGLTQTWLSKGALYSTYVTQKAITRNTLQQTQQDSTTHPAGIEVYAYEDSGGGVRYSIVDKITGQQIINNVLVNANAVKPKVLSLGVNVLILYYNSSDTKLYMAVVPSTSPTTALSPVALTNTGVSNSAVNTTNPNYDATVSGTSLYVAFNTTNSTTTIFKMAAGAPTVVTNQVSTAFDNGAPLALTLFADVNGGGVVWAGADTAAVRMRIWNSSLQIQTLISVETIGNVALLTGITQPTPARLTLFYTVSAAQTYNYFTKQAQFTQILGPPGILLWIGGSFMPYTSPGYLVDSGFPKVFFRSLALAGKAFLYQNLPYIPLIYQSPLQPTYFLADTNGNFAGKILSGLGGEVPTRSSLGASLLPESNQVSTSLFQFSFLAKSTLATQNGTLLTRSGVQSTTMNFFDPLNSYLRLQAGSTLLLSGGVPSIYDGVSMVEQNFLIYPEPVTATTSASGGTILPGTYQYIAIYTWPDGQGVLHRSTPSIATTNLTTSGSTSSNTITIPTLRATAKLGARTPVNVEVYRNAGETGGTVFYQVTSVIAPLQNSVTVDTVQFVDTLPDSSIIGNNTLYTTGGTVPDGPPNPFSSMTIHRNRVWALDSSNPLQLWFSKPIIPGATPVEFSPFFTLNIDSKGGQAFAIASLDEKLIIFRSNSIGFTYGDGPDNTGNGSFADVIPIVGADTGTSNPRSVVLVPRGLMFDSPKGKYLLTRGLTLEYVGADVEAFNGIPVTSAQLVPNTNQVRFALNNGTVLMFDYFVNEWSVHTNVNSVDSTLFQNLYTFLRNDGAVLQETPGLFLDAGRPIKLRLTTSWLQFAGLQGFTRVRKIYVLGEQSAPHTMQLSLAYNFDPAVIQSAIVTPASPVTYGNDGTYGTGTPYGDGFPLYQFRIDPTQQLCEAIQLSIEDINDSGSLSLAAILLEVGLKGRGFKLPATAQT